MHMQRMHMDIIIAVVNSFFIACRLLSWFLGSLYMAGQKMSMADSQQKSGPLGRIFVRLSKALLILRQ